MKRIVSIIIICILIISLIGCAKDNHDGEAKTPAISKKLKGKYYQDVVEIFEEQGFKNIKIEKIENLVFGWLTKDGEVKSVSVDGEIEYSSDVWYPDSVEVIITYHTFPPEKDEESFVKEDKEPAEQAKDLELEKEKEKKLVEQKERELREQKEKELRKQKEKEIKNIIDKSKGQLAIDIYNELKDLGYNAEFEHEITRIDFSETVVSTSDPNDTEFYIPWIITDSVSMDFTSKTASFLINTQEMLDEAQSKKAMEDILTDKLSPSVAWGSVDMYGKSNYPNGFKLNLVLGMLAETAIDEDTWFLKSTCEIKNQYGKWEKGYTCEAYVSGTTDSPKIIDFKVY